MDVEQIQHDIDIFYTKYHKKPSHIIMDNDTYKALAREFLEVSLLRFELVDFSKVYGLPIILSPAVVGYEIV